MLLDMSQGAGLEEFHQMMAYHLGWIGEGAGPGATGKTYPPSVGFAHLRLIRW